MEIQFKRGLFALTLFLAAAAAEATAQAAASTDAGAAFDRRINGGPEVSRRQHATDSSSILLYRADANRDARISRDEFVEAERSDMEERFILRDIDGDGLLRRDEIGPDMDRPERRRPGLDVNISLYRICMQMATGETPAHEDRFAQADLDGDGVLSQFEFSSWLEERAHAQFARLDDNQDGVLTPEELTDSFERRHHLRRIALACRELASDGIL